MISNRCQLMGKTRERITFWAGDFFEQSLCSVRENPVMRLCQALDEYERRRYSEWKEEARSTARYGVGEQ